MVKYFIIKPEKNRISKGINKQGEFVDLKNGQTLLFFDTEEEAASYIRTHFLQHFKEDKLRMLTGNWELCKIQPIPIRAEKVMYSFPLIPLDEQIDKQSIEKAKTLQEIADEAIKNKSKQVMIYGMERIHTFSKLHPSQKEVPEGYYRGYYVLN
jgi:hypothetical protein